MKFLQRSSKQLVNVDGLSFTSVKMFELHASKRIEAQYIIYCTFVFPVNVHRRLIPVVLWKSYF